MGQHFQLTVFLLVLFYNNYIFYILSLFQEYRAGVYFTTVLGGLHDLVEKILL